MRVKMYHIYRTITGFLSRKCSITSPTPTTDAYAREHASLADGPLVGWFRPAHTPHERNPHLPDSRACSPPPDRPPHSSPPLLGLRLRSPVYFPVTFDSIPSPVLQRLSAQGVGCTAAACRAGRWGPSLTTCQCRLQTQGPVCLRQCRRLAGRQRMTVTAQRGFRKISKSIALGRRSGEEM